MREYSFDISSIWLGPISAPDISARDISARTFRYMDVTTLGNFGIRIFRHMDVLAHVHFGTVQSNLDILAQTFRQRCLCSKISLCRNVPVQCRKVHGAEMSMVPRNTHAEMFSCRKVTMMKCTCRNVSRRNVRYRNKLRPSIYEKVNIFKYRIFSLNIDEFFQHFIFLGNSEISAKTSL